MAANKDTLRKNIAQMRKDNAKARRQRGANAANRTKKGILNPPSKKQRAETAAANRAATRNRMSGTTGNAALNEINRKARKAAAKGSKIPGSMSGAINKASGVSRARTIAANSAKTRSAFESQVSGKGRTDAVRTRSGESRSFSNTRRGMNKADAYLRLDNPNLTDKERGRLEKRLKNGGG